MKKLFIFTLFIMNFYSYVLLAETYRFATLEWTILPQASLYETEVKNIETGQLQYFKSKEATIEIKLTVGNYKVRMRSYDLRGAPGAWGNERKLQIKPPELTIKTKKSINLESTKEIETLEFSWEPMDIAKYYEVEIEDITQDEKQKIKTEKPFLKIDLPSRNQYKWTVKAVVNGIEGDISDKPQFVEIIGPKLNQPILEIPPDGFVENIVWEETPFAKSYEYQIYKNENNRWKKLEIEKSQTEKKYIDIPSTFAGGKYKIMIRAQGNLTAPSDWKEAFFDLKSGSRSKNALESFLKRTSLEMSTDKYFVASYLISSIDYKSRFIQTDVNFKALGGTGRIGMGYIKPRSSIGLYGIGDLSGFTINHKNHVFKSFEVHGFYRKKLDMMQYRISGGIFVRDLPEISSPSSIGSSQFDLVSVLGPQIGFEFWKVLTKEIGFQLNARSYYAMKKLQTPGHTDLVPTSSYQLGILGSYRVNRQILCLAGYAYRKDQISYKAKSGVFDNTSGVFANGTEINYISIQGHYLNLVLELGF